MRKREREGRTEIHGQIQHTHSVHSDTQIHSCTAIHTHTGAVDKMAARLSHKSCTAVGDKSTRVRVK